MAFKNAAASRGGLPGVLRRVRKPSMDCTLTQITLALKARLSGVDLFSSFVFPENLEKDTKLKAQEIERSLPSSSTTTRHMIHIQSRPQLFLWNTQPNN